MKNRAPLVLCTTLILLFLSIAPASALTTPEKLVYDVSWTGVKAATSVHEATARGNEVHLFSYTRSAPWIDTFFYVEDRAESVLTRNGDRFPTPKLYKQNNTQAKRRAVREATFDPVGLRVEFKDLLKKTAKTEPISNRTYDTLSAIYFVRSLDMAPGRSVFVDIHDAKKLWNTEVKVLRREEVTTPVGRFKTLVVQLKLRSGDGAGPKFRDMTIWVTDDTLKIPVMMTTKVKVGKLTATLVGGSYWPTAK